jgi:precorrin-2 methylase
MQLKTTLSLAMGFALAIGSVTAFAADTSKAGKPLTAQQEKMKSCNAEAKTKALAGADRKAFMKTCLSGSSASTETTAAAAAPAAKMTQQEKMKSCSTDAKDKKLKGADRKTFMSTCLKGESSGAAAH